MSTFRDFEDIEAWQKARRLTARVNEITRREAFSRELYLVDQLERSSLSVMSNIAGGFERGGTKEFINYLSISAASSSECRSHLWAALDAGLLTEDEFRPLRAEALECNKMIRALMNYLRRSSLRGGKYKRPEPSRLKTEN